MTTTPSKTNTSSPTNNANRLETNAYILRQACCSDTWHYLDIHNRDKTLFWKSVIKSCKRFDEHPGEKAYSYKMLFDQHSYTVITVI